MLQIKKKKLVSTEFTYDENKKLDAKYAIKYETGKNFRPLFTHSHK